ncbi:PREDICTED: dual specificity [Prunus dulcis]|uniref:protein-tyrosine-phosphatase n=1 Tax=Prunus dulcis TaxID=3755 RepID=A0A5E4FGV2_PRUDU|nr:PREDICTED: dual specificity [Prunus dulcis]
MERKMRFGLFHPIVSLLFFVNHTFPVPSNPSPIAHGSRLRDMDDDNLLDYLDVCVDFIDKKGSVLVHCFAGVSRRAAIITAYLMRTEHLSQEEALGSPRQSCEFVCPNDGFLDQLKFTRKWASRLIVPAPNISLFAG